MRALSARIRRTVADAPVEADATAASNALDAGLRFGFLIHDVSRLRRVVVDRALKPLGVTRSQWWVLAFLSRRDGMTQTALAADLDLTKVAIGGLLDRLEAIGFVERRADDSDGRARRVFLTREGAKLVNTIRQEVESVELAILNSIPDKALAQASQTLMALKAALLAMAGAEAADGEDPGQDDVRRRVPDQAVTRPRSGKNGRNKNG